MIWKMLLVITKPHRVIPRLCSSPQLDGALKSFSSLFWFFGLKMLMMWWWNVDLVQSQCTNSNKPKSWWRKWKILQLNSQLFFSGVVDNMLAMSTLLSDNMLMYLKLIALGFSRAVQLNWPFSTVTI